jgi:N-acetylneuraminic acid mutarotase
MLRAFRRLPVCAVVLIAALLSPQASQLAAAAASARPSSPAAVPPVAHTLRPRVSTSLHNDTSPPLKTMRAAPTTPGRTVRQIPGHVLGTSSIHNPPAQHASPGGPLHGSMPGFQNSFEGVNNIDQVLPPDPNGAVGSTQYMEWINLHLAVYDKQGNLLLGPVPGNTLFQGFGGLCESNNDGDPVVRYDAMSGRWFATQFAIGTNEFHQCVAVSQTSDATGSWNRYDFLISTTLFNDYPKFGVWPDAYYMSFNEFAGNNQVGAGAAAFERAKMLAGQPARMVQFDESTVSPNFRGQLPSDLDGTPPAAGTPNLFAQADDPANGVVSTNRLTVWQFHVDWTNPANSTFGTNGQPDFHVDTAPFVSNLCAFARSCIPQPGTTSGLDAISDRLMYRLQYRNFGDHQSLLAIHTVNVGNNQAGVDWHELRNTGSGWSMYQQGIYAPDSNNRWMGSGAIDASGDIAIGYSVSSSTVFPSIRAAGRLAADPLGQLAQGETELIAGTGSQTDFQSRWGDYTQMSIDPTDDCTYWYINEYMTQTGDAPWQTRVGSLKFPSCTTGPHGTLSGTVTNASNSQPIAGATVTAGTSSTSTDSTGAYQLDLPVGTYNMTVSAFGFKTATASGVAVTDGGTTTKNFALPALPIVTVSGTVTDGSGHGWPLYATITIAGVPNGTVYTDPVTGTYSIALPATSTYSFHVVANYPGYLPTDKSVHVGTGNLTQNFKVKVDPATCSAPGYVPGAPRGLYQAFDTGTLPTGWSVVDNAGTGQVWQFNDPHPRGNLTGGTGGFASIDSDNYGFGGVQDTSLVSPKVNLTGIATPSISFWNDYHHLNTDVADVDLSLDGGKTWTNVWERTTDARGPDHEQIAIPQAAGKTNVKVRFHYYNATFAWWWEVDDVSIGVIPCVPVHGALVMGHVTDANTGTGIDGAKVTSNDNPTDTAVTTTPPNDPNIGSGWYWMFSHLTGTHSFTASFGAYQSATASVSVVVNSATRADFALTAGHLVITPSSITTTQPMGDTRTTTMTIKNDGTAPADVKLVEQPGTFQIRKSLGTPVRNILGHFTPNRASARGLGRNASVKPPGAPSDAPWVAIADYPSNIMDNAVATFSDGRVFSVGGFDGSNTLATGNVFTPSTGAWTPITAMANAREKPSAAFINGKLYVVGGWGSDGNPVATLEIYDPSSGSWSTGASVPTPLAGSGVAVLNNKMYVVGGCDSLSCGHTEVFGYDPSSDSWTTVAAYPNQTSWLGCGGIGSKIYCAGGTGPTVDTATAYVYDSGTNAWTALPSLPVDLWAMGYAAANGKLLVSGGVTNGNTTVTNMGFSFDPTANTWTALPNSNNSLYRGGSACGFYKVGGSTGGFSPVPSSELLPGFGQCVSTTNVPWLSEHPTHASLAPGRSVTVTVTTDAGVSAVNQPGTYTAKLAVGSNTPYSYPAVDVTMVVTPPSTWGKITGTVTGVACHGGRAPIAGATVQINTWAGSFTLQTDANGVYALWLDVRNNPLTLIVAKDGWQPQTTTTTITRHNTTTVNFNLKPTGC